MTPDDEICYCYHVSLRKLLNFARREKPRHPAQLSDCLGAGTGCGWCIPTLCRIAASAVTGNHDESLSDLTPEQYAAQRQTYIREKRPRHAFNPPATAAVTQSPDPLPDPPAPLCPFVLLEHTTHDNIHWDFMLALPGCDKLATWRLLSNPLSFDRSADAEIPAERLPDHRRIYLEFEGPISGDRGHVRRLDCGPARLLAARSDGYSLEITGLAWRGAVELILGDVPRWTLFLPKAT